MIAFKKEWPFSGSAPTQVEVKGEESLSSCPEGRDQQDPLGGFLTR